MPVVLGSHGSLVLGARSLGSEGIGGAAALARAFLDPDISAFGGIDTSNAYMRTAAASRRSGVRSLTAVGRSG